MHVLLNLPAQRPVQILRPQRVCQVLLSPDNVAHSEQMIIDGRSKVEHGPDPVLRAHPRMRILHRINNAKRRPVPDRRVRMSQVSLYSKYRLPLSKPSIQHLRPMSQVLLRALRAIWTRSTSVDVDTEIFRSTGADVRVSLFQNLLRMLVVNWNPVASNVLGIPLAFQPANILSDQIIVLERRLFQPGVSVIEPQEKVSLVHPRIVV